MTHGGRRRHHRVAQKQIIENPVSIKNKRKARKNSAIEKTLLLITIVLMVTNIMFTVADIIFGAREDK